MFRRTRQAPLNHSNEGFFFFIRTSWFLSDFLTLSNPNLNLNVVHNDKDDEFNSHYQRVSMVKSIHDVQRIFCFQVFPIMSNFVTELPFNTGEDCSFLLLLWRILSFENIFKNIFKNVWSSFISFYNFVVDLTIQHLSSRKLLLFPRVSLY